MHHPEWQTTISWSWAEALDTWREGVRFSFKGQRPNNSLLPLSNTLAFTIVVFSKQYNYHVGVRLNLDDLNSHLSSPSCLMLLKHDSRSRRNGYTLKQQYVNGCLEAVQEKCVVSPILLPLSWASLHPFTYHSFWLAVYQEILSSWRLELTGIQMPTTGVVEAMNTGNKTRKGVFSCFRMALNYHTSSFSVPWFLSTLFAMTSCSEVIHRALITSGKPINCNRRLKYALHIL